MHLTSTLETPVNYSTTTIVNCLVAHWSIFQIFRVWLLRSRSNFQWLTLHPAAWCVFLSLESRVFQLFWFRIRQYLHWIADKCSYKFKRLYWTA